MRLFGLDHRVIWGVFAIAHLVVVGLMVCCMMANEWYSTKTWSGSLRKVVSGEQKGETYETLREMYCEKGQDSDQKLCEMFTNLSTAGFYFPVFEVMAIIGIFVSIGLSLANILYFRHVIFSALSLICSASAHITGLCVLYLYIDFSCHQGSVCAGTGLKLLGLATCFLMLFVVPKGVAECYYKHKLWINKKPKKIFNYPQIVVIAPPDIQGTDRLPDDWSNNKLIVCQPTTRERELLFGQSKLRI